MFTGICCLHAFVISVSKKGTRLYIHILALVEIWIIKVRIDIYWFKETHTCIILVVKCVQNEH